MDPAAAERLIAKLRSFATEVLDDDERALFATLLAPGIARAYADADEVRGFGIDEWSGAPLTEALVEAVRSSGLRVVGLDDQPSPNPPRPCG